MRLTSISVAIALATLVAGCQTLSDVTGLGSSRSTTSDAPAAAVALAPAVAPAPTSAASVKDSLSGLTADGLRAAWGEPTLKRSETGAELWQYGSSSCTLLFYLYPGAGNALTVSRVEAIPGGADDAAITTCAKTAGRPPLKPIS